VCTEDCESVKSKDQTIFETDLHSPPPPRYQSRHSSISETSVPWRATNANSSRTAKISSRSSVSMTLPNFGFSHIPQPGNRDRFGCVGDAERHSTWIARPTSPRHCEPWGKARFPRAKKKQQIKELILLRGRCRWFFTSPEGRGRREAPGEGLRSIDGAKPLTRIALAMLCIARAIRPLPAGEVHTAPFIGADRAKPGTELADRASIPSGTARGRDKSWQSVPAESGRRGASRRLMNSLEVRFSGGQTHST